MEKETGQARLDVYVETLRARMPPNQFILLMRAFHAWLTGGGMTRLHLEPAEQELFTPELQGEILTLMGLVRSLSPADEGRDDEVVVTFGDGEHVRDARTLVPADVAGDPGRLAEMRQRLEDREEQRAHDTEEVRAIARASGLLPTDDSTST